MDPTLPEVISNEAPSQEQVPMPPGSSPGNVESAPNIAPEQPRERALTVSPTSSPVTAPDPTPVAPVSSGPTPSHSTDNTDTPVIADDVDVIEKEWVDKAKKIVNSTKEDPYSQEKEVSKLQADYLMKRYNKQVRLSE